MNPPNPRALSLDPDHAAAVYAIFPDIDPKFVADLLAKHANDSEAVAAEILDRSDPYPRLEKPAQPKGLKRKREDLDESDDLGDENLRRLRERFDGAGEATPVPEPLKDEV